MVRYITLLLLRYYMYVASRMQNTVQIRAWNACFATKLDILFFVAAILLDLSALRAPTVGP